MEILIIFKNSIPKIIKKEQQLDEEHYAPLVGIQIVVVVQMLIKKIDYVYSAWIVLVLVPQGNK